MMLRSPLVICFAGWGDYVKVSRVFGSYCSNVLYSDHYFCIHLLFLSAATYLYLSLEAVIISITFF